MVNFHHWHTNSVVFFFFIVSVNLLNSVMFWSALLCSGLVGPGLVAYLALISHIRSLLCSPAGYMMGGEHWTNHILTDASACLFPPQIHCKQPFPYFRTKPMSFTCSSAFHSLRLFSLPAWACSHWSLLPLTLLIADSKWSIYTFYFYI